MVIITVVTLYPFLQAFAISLNDANDTARGGITILPRVFTLRNYELIFQRKDIIRAYSVTIMRTLIGTLGALLFTTTIAFGMAHKNLVFGRFYTILCVIPMYFGGGLIPFFVLIRQLGLMNSFWVYIIPNLVGIYNMILMRTFFKGIPDALEESARIDGANAFTILIRIIIPISTPIIATISLFVAVMQWNSWFDAAIFISNMDLKPMQSILLSVISGARFAEQLARTAGGSVDAGNIARGAAKVNVRSITMATTIVTIIPIVVSYPFLQRYFIKGVMVGSLKG
jgi:putative aldouronate transport system permease protein